MVIDPEHGTIDSPLHPSQVDIIPGIPEALNTLTRAGYGLAIVTNQPASAKGKTSRKNLEDTHRAILEVVQNKGGRILSSHICYHQAEDHCLCRKPKTALLEDSFKQNPGYARSASWMVGDGVVDILAGAAFGLKTGFLGPRKEDAIAIFHELNIRPDRWEASLPEFVAHLVPVADNKRETF